ncbi:MAG: extracellular solute-binding protein [Candidatus Marinimicrobia bacterium]|nr:extracellular solute-binding protein [Candidatus Neomarinimicrobiota bacterium]
MNIKNHKRNLRKIHISVIGLFCLLCVFQLCEKKQNGGQQKDSKIHITYWCASNQDEIDLAQYLVDQWNAANDSIKVKMQPIPASQSSEEVLLAAIAAGTTPDICSNMWPGAMDDFIASGGLVRLDQFPDFVDCISERVPADLLKTFLAPDGHFYQIPWKTNPIMIVYNKNIFRDAGVDFIPRTYSEYIKAGRKITRDLDGDGNLDVWLSHRDTKPIWWQRFFDYYTFYIAASGGQTLFEGSEIIFNNEASVKVFDFFRQLYKEGLFAKTTFIGDAFILGKLATQIAGPWHVSHVEKFRPPGFEYGIFPVPVPDDYEGPVYTFGDFKNISIFGTTKHPEATYAFAKYLVTAEADLKLLEFTLQIPIRKDLTENPLFEDFFEENPNLVYFAEQAPYTRGMDGVSDLKEIFDAISQEYEACAIFNRRDPAQAVENAARRAKVIMEWNRSR